MRYVNCIVLLCVLFFFIPIAALAGSLDDHGAPTTAGGGAMNTLEDIYNIINDGTTNEPRSGTFAEPSAGPASTGHTLTEIYNRTKTSSRPAKTAQTTSYRTHDDGDLEKGVAWPSTRFTDNNNGTVTDNLTGLIWLKDASCAAWVKWHTAIDYAAALYDGCTTCFDTGGDCGLSDGSLVGDWRIPNVKEWLSLIDWANSEPALPSGHPFTGVITNYYWSSTAYADNPDTYAWMVNLNNSYLYNGDKTDASSLYNVWPVRGGQ